MKYVHCEDIRASNCVANDGNKPIDVAENRVNVPEIQVVYGAKKDRKGVG
jgi:hypothetical protein